MAAAFAGEGDDACVRCADPAFSYFLVSGSLMPIKVVGMHVAPPSLPLPSAPLFYSSPSCSSHRPPPTEEVAAVAESKAEETSTGKGSPKVGKQSETFVRPVACEVEKPPGLDFCSWTYPCDSNSICGSALTPARENGCEKPDDGGDVGRDVGSAVSESLFSVPLTMSATKVGASPSAPNAYTVRSAKNEDILERVQGSPLLPGQSLDPYLAHTSIGAAGETSPDGTHGEAGRPEVVYAFPEGSAGDETTGTGRWRLEAQERVCVGRVSRRFLSELEREEPKHDVEVKVAFLRKTEASRSE